MKYKANKKEYNKEYYLKNKERIKERKRLYYERIAKDTNKPRKYDEIRARLEEVDKLLKQGLKPKEIADKLNISLNTCYKSINTLKAFSTDFKNSETKLYKRHKFSFYKAYQEFKNGHEIESIATGMIYNSLDDVAGFTLEEIDNLWYINKIQTVNKTVWTP